MSVMILMVLPRMKTAYKVFLVLTVIIGVFSDLITRRLNDIRKINFQAEYFML